jgi:hypothetical protein
MQSPQDSLTHEAAALFRLVDSIDRFVAEQQNSYTYTDSTETFFRKIRADAEATKKVISTVVQESARRPEDIERRYRPALIIQKDQWRTLHTYIKPASDAHTLSLPVPLINLAQVHLRSIKGMEATEIVVLLTPELMYYQNLPRLRILENLVFVELPYSQGPSFFTNLTIYHELGHYAFEKLETDETKGTAVKLLAQMMEKSFDAKLGQVIKTASTRTWAKRVLRAWTREVFCDLFALRFLGPAFTFALIDVLSLIDLMQEGTTVVVFDQEHPAPALRLKLQVDQLKRDGWWHTVKDLPSDHVRLSNRLASKSLADYDFMFDDDNIAGFVETFVEIVPYISPLVEEITPDPRKAADDFKNRKAHIEDCLLQGIVPSHLVRPESPGSPEPVSLINAAYTFYLTQMPKLMDKLIDQEPLDLDQRSNLIGKIESWTLKALEDYQLYADQGKTY